MFSHFSFALLAQTESESAGPKVDPDRLWHLAEQYAVPAVTVIIILVVAVIVSAWAKRAVQKSCSKVRLDETLAGFFGTAVKWGVMMLAGLFCLSKFGIETASFAVVLGSAGLALGLAFQGTLGNFASGVMLLIFRPFKIGDRIQISGQTGKVAEIELFSTALDTPDNRRIVIPNGAVFGSTIENVTFHATRRVDVLVGTDYAADLDATRSILLQAAQGVEDGLKDPKPQIVLVELGASAIAWQVRLWCNTGDYLPIKDALTRAVKVALDEANIRIPFPQMDVHVENSVA